MEKTTKNSKLTPRFFFISLGVLVSLITSVSSFLVLFFEVLNKKFPDILNSSYMYGYNSYNFEAIRASLATLIIFFPIFIVLSYFWVKLSNKEIGSVDKIIRKWMIYLILFLASLVIVIDLITLVRYFVSGEITNRFVFKVIVTLLIAAIVDFYYFKSIKLNNKCSKKAGIFFGIISGLLFFWLVFCSFSVMGSPSSQRAWRLDQNRVNDLQNIQYQVINYWQQKEKLPENLSELNNPISNSFLPVDPEFEQGRTYEYYPKEKLSFELCATFSAEMPEGWQDNNRGGMMPMYEIGMNKAVSSIYPGGMNSSWDHEIGRTCFTRTIDKDLYPVFKD